jgi:tRNA A-37 threonylcarbamoyl transferase component Bud32
MDYYVSARSITNAPSRNKRREKWAAAARKLVKSFHGRSWVHGDLRDVNFLCYREKPMLVDFNWGGKDGRYAIQPPFFRKSFWRRA